MVVEIHFTLKNDKGEVLDTTENDEMPFVYLHGAGNIIEGLEDALEDLTQDSDFEVTVPPEKGYGIKDMRKIGEIPLEHFPEDIDLAVGQQFVAESPEGPRPIYIKEIRDETAIVDGNHELAGETLHYSGKVVSIREATDSELQNGQVGSSCCSGGTCSENIH